MNITAGPMIKQYAACYGIDEHEAVDWVNDYVNHPGNFAAVIKAGLMEPSEKDRAKSIMDYITRRVDESMTTRVKKSLREEKGE